MASVSIEDAKRELAVRVMRIPGVTAVGIGELSGSPCLRVWVIELTDALRAALPEELHGYAVQVAASGPIRALDESD